MKKGHALLVRYSDRNFALLSKWAEDEGLSLSGAANQLVSRCLNPTGLPNIVMSEPSKQPAETPKPLPKPKLTTADIVAEFSYDEDEEDLAVTMRDK
jgi:hypothetical protein